MITERKQFTEMLFNYLWAYIILLISQLIMSVYYPPLFEIYSIMLNYIYLIGFEIFKFIKLVLYTIFNTYNSIFLVFGVILIVLAFYKLFMKLTFDNVKRGFK